MKKTSVLLVVSFLLIFPLILGCGGAKLKTVFVEGVITLDGKPLADAMVKFSPKDDGGGATYAQGQTDSSGRYLLTAMQGGGTGKGTTPGEYIVLVTKHEIRQLDKPMESMGGAPPKTTETVNVLPKVYNDVKAARFSATVVAGKNKFDFNIESDAK